MPADPMCLEMPNEHRAISEEGISDSRAIAAAERALEGARGAELSARVARSSVEVCRIEASSAQVNAGTARLAVSSADASAESAASCAAAACLHADRAAKSLRDVQRIGWAVALVGVGILFGLTLALALYAIAVWLPPHAPLYLRTPAEVPSARAIWTRS